MLQITIPGTESWDEKNQEFVYGEDTVLKLEHSLVSISKWESKWNKAFLSRVDKTEEETLDYIMCMTVNRNVSPDVYSRLTREHIDMIQQYISAPMTATCFSKEESGKANSEVVTSELIYYWMVALTIPFECQHWHLNRLLTLVRVCNIKNQPPKKRSKRETMSRNAALNAARRKKYNSKG